MKKKIILLAIFLLVGIARAGSISMTLSTESVFFPDSMNVSLKNSGDESALNVRLSVLSDSFEADDVFLKRLDSNQEMNSSLALNKTGDILPGSYPVVILTRYEDLNGYPFSSVSPNYIAYGEMTNSDIYATIQDAKLAKEGTVALKMRNLGDKELKTRVRLFLPMEIKSENEKNITIAPKSEKEVSFKISNFGALVGSSYVVLASVEYSNEKQYSTFARGVVSIVEEKGIFDQNLLIIVLAILIIIFIAYQLKDKFIKKDASKQ
jgi:hypothetical protein